MCLWECVSYFLSLINLSFHRSTQLINFVQGTILLTAAAAPKLNVENNLPADTAADLIASGRRSVAVRWARSQRTFRTINVQNIWCPCSPPRSHFSTKQQHSLSNSSPGDHFPVRITYFECGKSEIKWNMQRVTISTNAADHRTWERRDTVYIQYTWTKDAWRKWLGWHMWANIEPQWGGWVIKNE